MSDFFGDLWLYFFWRFLHFLRDFWGHFHSDFEYSFGYDKFFVVFHESKYDIWPVGHFRVYKLCILFTNILGGIQLRLIHKIGNDDVRHIYICFSFLKL